MDATRTRYSTPEVATKGDLVTLTQRIVVQKPQDASLTGQFNAEGSVGFQL